MAIKINVEMARNIAQKYNLKMPTYWRGRYCKGCKKFLKPGLNSKVRLSRRAVTIECLECGEVSIMPYLKEQKSQRRKKIESRTFQEGINE